MDKQTFILARLHKVEAYAIEEAERLEGDVVETFHTVAAPTISGLFDRLHGQKAGIEAAANPPVEGDPEKPETTGAAHSPSDTEQTEGA